MAKTMAKTMDFTNENRTILTGKKNRKASGRAETLTRDLLGQTGFV
jgi:hypothetical protein